MHATYDEMNKSTKKIKRRRQQQRNVFTNLIQSNFVFNMLWTTSIVIVAARNYSVLFSLLFYFIRNEKEQKRKTLTRTHTYTNLTLYQIQCIVSIISFCIFVCYSSLFICYSFGLAKIERNNVQQQRNQNRNEKCETKLCVCISYANCEIKTQNINRRWSRTLKKRRKKTTTLSGLILKLKTWRPYCFSVRFYTSPYKPSVSTVHVYTEYTQVKYALHAHNTCLLMLDIYIYRGSVDCHMTYDA